MLIRKAEPADAQAIAAIILPTIREGATYSLDTLMSEAQALAYWMDPDKETFVAEVSGKILGTYYSRTCEHSLNHARQQGYRAMQFNFVVSINEGAIRLWQRKGFEVVGRLPHAF